MKKIIVVAGARPNFMKIAPLMHALAGHKEIETVLVHTGQHYDVKMSGQFFEELNIPSPSCGACLSNMAITPGGNVVPCQSWLSDKPLGNMLTDDWNDIWDSDTCQERRAFSAQLTGECPLRRYC